VLSGTEFGAVRDAITRAFTPDEFDMFLYERLNFDRSVNVADGPFKVVVNNVLKSAANAGWEATLIAEVAAVRPLKQDIQQVYERYALALVDEGRRQNVEAERIKAMQRFGLIPNLRLQKGGVTQLPAATSITDEGLQRRVRQDLPFLDVGLWREQILRLEAQVCRVEMQGAGVGTGFLIGPDVLLTNYHVMLDAIENRVKPEEVKLRFDFRVLPTGLHSNGTLVSLAATNWLLDFSKYTASEAAAKPDETLPTIDELDYAIVRLSQPVGSEPLHKDVASSSTRGWISLPSTAPAVATGQPILILQHPQAAPLALALDTNGVIEVNANQTRIRYSTNTESGSSGSPCFDLNWGLLALHHYGDPAYNHPRFNQGIPAIAIRDRLARIGKLDLLGGQPPVS
jgi:hypothetical protein